MNRLTLQRSGLVLGILALLALAGCSKEEEAPPPPIRPVLSVVVTPQAAVAQGFAGTIEPRFSRDLGFQVLGRMVARDVELGQTVKTGQILAALDPLALDLSVRSLTADLAKAEAQLVNATATRERQQALVARQVGAQSALDTAEEARSAAAAVAARGKAALDKARERLSYTRLVSETDGVVTAVNAEIGQTVTAGQTIVTIAQVDIRDAVVDIPDEIAQTIKEGDPFQMTLQIDPDLKASGIVREIAPQADAATRTRRVKITLETPPETFRIGTTVTATRKATGLSSIDLPQTALLEEDGKTFVWVVDEKALTVSRRPVEIAGTSGQILRIESGIDVGTRVVIAGVHSLKDGQSVKIDQEITP